MRGLAASAAVSAAPGSRAGVGPVVFACDANYAMPLATVIRSLVENNRKAWPLDVHVFWEGPEAICRRVEESLPPGAASIRWIPVDLDAFQGLATPPGVSRMTYARLLIPSVFAESVERVLYLDVDMLVLGELAPLFGADLRGAVAGAVPDVALARVRGTGEFTIGAAANDNPAMAGLLRFWRQALPRVPQVADYFNAGMLLIDLPRWREAHVSEAALAFLQQNPTSPFSDQDALNVACDGKWVRVAPRWNHQDHLLERIAELDEARRPGIVHFATSDKPWKASAASDNAALWDDYRGRTRFARTRRERAADALQARWVRAKRGLMRVKVLRALWRALKPRQA